MNEDVLMFLFARWISTSYADSHLDGDMNLVSPSNLNGISVLNRESGSWYKEQIKFFKETVLPNYHKNGTVEDTIKFLEYENNKLI